MRFVVLLSTCAVLACGGSTLAPPSPPVETPTVPSPAPDEPPPRPTAPARTPDVPPAVDAPAPTTPPAPKPAPAPSRPAAKKAPPPWSSISTSCQTDRDCVISCEGACCAETCGCTIAVNGASLQAWRDAGGVRDCAGVQCRAMGCDYQPATGAMCSNGTCRPTIGLSSY
jgi:hypothetical protein